MTRKKRVAVLGLGHWYSAYGLGRALRVSPSRAGRGGVARPAQLEQFTASFGVKGYRDSARAARARDRSTSSTSRRRSTRSRS